MNEELDVPPKKKGIPSWLLFCGSGCLIAIVLTVIGGFLLFEQGKKMINPDLQWDKMEQVVEMDARPHELRIMFGWNLGMDVWMMRDKRGYIVAVYDFGESDADSRDEIFGENFSGGGLPGVNKIEDTALGDVVVQGRTLLIQRFMNSGGVDFGNGGASGGGAGCFVDITPEDDLGFTMLFMMKDPSKNEEDVNEPISDEAIQALLTPFVIGPDRTPYVSPGPHPQDGVDQLDFDKDF
ncbi:MAG: hypothetical protein ACI9F9_001921 [Candidatus Paceibacteria bacterium]|jgi:hypothetical protein